MPEASHYLKLWSFRTAIEGQGFVDYIRLLWGPRFLHRSPRCHSEALFHLRKTVLVAPVLQERNPTNIVSMVSFKSIHPPVWRFWRLGICSKGCWMMWRSAGLRLFALMDLRIISTFAPVVTLLTIIRETWEVPNIHRECLCRTLATWFVSCFVRSQAPDSLKSLLSTRCNVLREAPSLFHYPFRFGHACRASGSYTAAAFGGPDDRTDWGPKVLGYQKDRNFSGADLILRSWERMELRVKRGVIVILPIHIHPMVAGKLRKSKMPTDPNGIPFALQLPTWRAANVSVAWRNPGSARGWWRGQPCDSARLSYRRPHRSEGIQGTSRPEEVECDPGGLPGGPHRERWLHGRGLCFEGCRDSLKARASSVKPMHSRCTKGPREWATWTCWPQGNFQVARNTKSCCTMFASPANMAQQLLKRSAPTETESYAK